MKNLLTTALATMLCLGATPAMSQTKNVSLKVIETSDIHGCFFPYDFIERKPLKGTLARVSTYVEPLRVLVELCHDGGREPGCQRGELPAL